MNKQYETCTIEEIDTLMNAITDQYIDRLIPTSVFKAIYTALDDARREKIENSKFKAYKRAMRVV